LRPDGAPLARGRDPTRGSAPRAYPKAVLELLCGYQSRDPIRRYLHGQRRRLIARMIRKYGKAGGHALDVGSGIGTYVPHLLHRFETVTCIDHCAHLLAYVRERFPVEDRLRLVRADAHRLPFPDGGFDFVICS
jgi:ubiquinone/menaquinone biosynthesis C-methylase UbiE